MSPSVPMDIVDNRVPSHTGLFVRDAAEGKNLHVEERCADTDSVDMELHERLLIHVSE